MSNSTLPEDLRTSLAVDRYALDDMLVQQPELIYEVGLFYARAVDQRDALKDDLARIMAEVSADVREEVKGLTPKVTEGGISERVLQNKKVLQAQEALREAKLAAAEAGELKEAFSQRSYMLKDLVNLYLNEYFTRTNNSVTSVKEVEAEKARDAHKRRRRTKSEG